jgi:DNA-binding CsgD family transcriptional regulator/tetratricopeptide (TPR) repeat protein
VVVAQPQRADEAPADGRLVRGREAAAQLAWEQAYQLLSGVDPAVLGGEDSELLATAAYLTGQVPGCLDALRRAHQVYVDAGNRCRAARCLFWVGFVLLERGDLAQGGGWLARASRLLAGEPGTVAEHGLLRLPQVFSAAAAGDHAAAARSATEAAQIGDRAGDAEVAALGRHWQGRSLLRLGRVQEGLALLDESMVAVVAGEVAPYVAGGLYCSMIGACHEVADLRRAREWTVALTTWCEQQPEMSTFSGQCLVHRAEIMQRHGQWTEAIEEARRARDRFARAADQYAAGAAWYRLGELHRVRGEHGLAEAAYRQAAESGAEPQPGLALLRLAEGATAAAQAAIQRAVAEATAPLLRAALLPAQVEIALAGGDLDRARTAADELAATADTYDTPALRAVAGHTRGAVLLAAGDARDALAALRGAWQLWRELDAPYDAARVRVLVGLGCRALGDEEAAGMELDSARRVFVQLGAAPELTRVDTLRPPAGTAGPRGLTARELQVLRLLAAGKTNRDIAADLVLAAKTVDRHVSNIFAKLGVSSRAAATAFAYQHQLVPSDGSASSPRSSVSDPHGR